MAHVLQKADAYRFDVRTPIEFVEDIGIWHTVEGRAVKLFRCVLSNALRTQVSVEPTGCGMDGGFLPLQEVSKDPDFLLSVPGRSGALPLEVKSMKHALRVIHFKVDQVLHYIENFPNVRILVVRKAFHDIPQFSLVEPSGLLEYPSHKFSSWGGKECFCVPANAFRWEHLVPRDHYSVGFLTDPWMKTVSGWQSCNR